MNKKLLNQIRNEWRSNLWIVIELFLSSVVIWYLVDYVSTTLYTYSRPMGFDITHCYYLSLSSVDSNSPAYDPNDTIANTDVDEIVTRLRTNRDIEAVSISIGAYPYSTSINMGKLNHDTVSYDPSSYFRAIDPSFFLVFRYRGVHGETPQQLARMMTTVSGGIMLSEVNFNATLPCYNQKYSSYQNSEGSYSFVRNNYMELSGDLSVDQNVWLTGGTLSLNTSLDYLRELSGTKNKQFMSIPFALTFNQPLFAVNDTKWKRRIQPVKYDEAKANFLSATEEVTMSAIRYFFNLLLANENVVTAQQNLDNANKLYEVAVVKRRMGKISENDLLQLRLNVLRAQSTLTDNTSTIKSNMFRLRSFLGISEEVDLEPVVPEKNPSVELNYDEVLAKAQENNAFNRSVVRRQLQADYEVAQAKGNLRKITLYAQVGYTGTDSHFGSRHSPGAKMCFS